MNLTKENPVAGGMAIEEESGLTLQKFTDIFHEIRYQPSWRAQADKEMDYRDGNQLGSDLLARMEELGIPPVIKNQIGVAIEGILGAEAKKRTDWRVIPDGTIEDEEIADAFNYKLNQAERRSRADRACSDAYESQVCVGVGWVEVSRASDPFAYPYRCQAVHRNEIYFDWPGYLKSPMGEDARYLVRSKWVTKEIARLQFPEQAELVDQVTGGWANYDSITALDGSTMTGLSRANDVERNWSIEEQEWRDVLHNKVRLFEVWYRVWESAIVIRMQDGRVVELNEADPTHIEAIVSGATPKRATVSRVRRAWFLGCHKLSDEPSPYRHRHFPYVPFWGLREDRTGVPYGRIRNMITLQDLVNSTISKIRWGLAAVRVERTEGAFAGTDEQLRSEISRPDADIVLNRQAMQSGGIFKVERDFQLNQQQYQLLADSEAGIKAVSGISDEFQGSQGTSTSGVQFSAQVEQSQQSLANIDDNFKESRSQVGELLLSMIIQDSMGQPEEVAIPGSLTKPDRTVMLNAPSDVIDEQGTPYLTNDVSRVMLKVTLDDVPSTPSFRTQQLNSLSEAYKASPPDYQRIMMPHMLSLMDIPDKKEIVDAIKQADSQPSPDAQEVEGKLKLMQAQTAQIGAQAELAKAQAVKVGTEAQFAAMQAAGQLYMSPGMAPIADAVMQNAGYQQPTPAGVDPNFPVVGGGDMAQQPEQLPPVQQNTSPQLPPVPQQPASPMTGVETRRLSDNM